MDIDDGLTTDLPLTGKLVLTGALAAVTGAALTLGFLLAAASTVMRALDRADR